MRSRSPCSRARACSASWAYCSGLLPDSVEAVNMAGVYQRTGVTMAPWPRRCVARKGSDRMAPTGLFVTGTDTGVGKTLVTATLLHVLRDAGVRALGMKPLASGCERIDGAWRNEDALALQRAGAFEAPYE